jgi:hypothetical protein
MPAPPALQPTLQPVPQPSKPTRPAPAGRRGDPRRSSSCPRRRSRSRCSCRWCTSSCGRRAPASRRSRSRPSAQTLQVFANTAVLASPRHRREPRDRPAARVADHPHRPARPARWAVLTAVPSSCRPTSAGSPTSPPSGPAGCSSPARPPRGGAPPGDLRAAGAVLTLTLFSYPYLLLTVRGALLGMDPPSRTRAAASARARPDVPPGHAAPAAPAIGAGSLLVALYVPVDFGAVSLLRFSSFTRVIYVQYQGGVRPHPRRGARVAARRVHRHVLLASRGLRGTAPLPPLQRGSRRDAPVIRSGAGAGRRWRSARSSSLLALVGARSPCSASGSSAGCRPASRCGSCGRRPGTPCRRRAGRRGRGRGRAAHRGAERCATAAG